MRLKGINPIEKHVEKLVLVLFGLVLLGLLVLQFLGSPNAVEVKGRTYAPEDAREPIRQLAQQKKGQIESIEPATELEGDLPDYVTPFQLALEGQGASGVEIAALGTSTIVRPETSGGSTSPGLQSDENLLYIAQADAPSDPLVAPFEGAVDPLAALPIKSQVPQFADQPFDLRGITVQTSFDASSFKAALNTPPANRNRLPLDWMRTIQVLDVEYARQRLENGEWVDDGLVPAMPGRESIRDAIADPNVRPVDLQDILRAERDARKDIRSPELYPMIAGLPWVAPADFAKVRRALPDQAQVTRLLSSLRSKDTEIERLTARRTDLADPEGRNQSQAQRLDREIENAKSERQKILDELSTLGVDETGALKDASDGAMTAAAPDAERMQNLLDEIGEITLWTHDVTLTPGASYRYRARVVLTNPLFGRASRLKPDQKPLAEGLTVATDWSAWSAPINIPESVQYFVLDANVARPRTDDAAAQPTFARITAARFFYGYWRTAQTRLDVGSILSAQATLPELWTWEIVEGESGPTLGETIALPSTLDISSPSFLLGVARAIQDTEAPALHTLVLLTDGQSDAPVIRTPKADQGSTELATIRFSAQKGQTAGLKAMESDEPAF